MKFVTAVALLVGTFSFTLWPGVARADGWSRIYVGSDELQAGEIDHIRPLHAATDAAYALLPRGTLVRIPFDGSEPLSIGFPSSPVGIAVDHRGQIWMLAYEPLSQNAFLLTAPKYHDRYGGVWTMNVSPPLHLQQPPNSFTDGDFPKELAAGSDKIFVVTDKHIAAFDIATATWRLKRLVNPQEMVDFENPVTLVQDDRWIWLGSDSGEFGGMLLKIDYKTGTETAVDDNDTVTGLVNEPGHPGCVIFSSGLAHLMTLEGVLYESCGDKPKLIWKEENPIWGLVEPGNKIYALTQGALVPFLNGKLDFDKKIAFPHHYEKALAGIPALVISNVLVVYSGARGEVSTAGDTPFAAALPAGAEVQLKPYKPQGAATAGTSDTGGN